MCVKILVDPVRAFPRGEVAGRDTAHDLQVARGETAGVRALAFSRSRPTPSGPRSSSGTRNFSDGVVANSSASLMVQELLPLAVYCRAVRDSSSKVCPAAGRAATGVVT